tara:strand:+ start:898 stop:1323 length:426 start_codon:yes stop_codon:yes gene_type:complete
MKIKEITKIVNKYYPLICADYNSTALVDFHYNIYERLSGEKGMTGEVCAHAEYDWSKDKIYIYTSRMKCEEDIIRSLIHECVHSRQLKCTFDFFYENGHTYDTHPYEIEARNAEENWKDYKFAEFDEWMNALGEKNGYTEY